MWKRIAGIIWLAGVLLTALAGYGLVGLGGRISGLAQNHAAVFGLVAVLVSLLAGILLAGMEQAAKSLFRRKMTVVAGK